MTDSDAPPDSPARDGTKHEGFLVVGIGASAGGIDALRAFFKAIPEDSGAAYVVILHLSPTHESRLAELLQSAAAIPVMQVRERLRVEPDHAYVIPPNQSLSMEDGHLALSEMTRLEERRAPVDIFFRTLGESQGSRAVAVILSGTGSDGSSGMKRVKEHGGLCIVQEPSEAEHADMPRHAIQTQLVDDVLLVSEIPAKIYAYKHHLSRLRAEGEPAADDDEIRGILAQLRNRTGHDFSTYKPATILRRIERRIAFHGLGGLQAYAQRLRDHEGEAAALLKDLLISVTNFFRDTEAFDALEHEVIPKLFAGKGVDDHVRVWVAGCATGEEAYTVAILLCECAAKLVSVPAMQIFATDMDEWALAKARAGFYTASDVASVTPERLRRFFVAERDGYRVRPELREMVLFAAHNVLKHPPYSNLDLITCRNLLIYISRAAQQRILEVFHFGLKVGGFIFLGSSESLDGPDLFAPLNKAARIFQRRTVDRRTALAFADLNLRPAALIHDEAQAEPRRQASIQERLSRQALHQRLLEQYAAPSVVIDDAREIVHMSDNAGRYMQISGGEPTKDLLSLVRPELRPELRTALYEAKERGARAATRAISLSIDGAIEYVNVSACPATGSPEEGAAFTLVLFEKGDEPGEARRLDADHVPTVAEPALRQLEDELRRVQAELRITSEEHELQREELKASNEELQSINEELRSTSEELETGKEELQSYNEELSTVNQELKVTIDELSVANDDTLNLMNSTDTATVFLDRGLCVKRFTPRARDLFSLIPADLGRPLLHVTNRLRYGDLASDVDHVLTTLQTVEREVESDLGRWFIAKAAPYRTQDDRIEGAVLTFTEITERKNAEDAVRATEEQFRRAIEDAPIPVIMQAEDGEVLQLSRSWTELTGYTVSDIPNVDAWLNRAYGEGADAVRAYMKESFTAFPRELDVEFAITTRSGDHRHWSFRASSTGALRDGRRFIIGMAVDITDRRRAADALTRSETYFRLVIDSVRDYAIFTMDAAGDIDTWNIGAERIFGYTEQEAVGQSARMIFTPEDRAVGAPEEEMRVAREEGSAPDERWHIRKNGDRFYASGILSAVLNGGGLVGYSKVAQDLTARREAETALSQAREDLEVRVAQRTHELAQINTELKKEVAERKQSEDLRVRLLGQLVDAQENERRRIARELHDQLGQQVTALRLKLSSLKMMDALHATARDEIGTLEGITEQIDADLDFLVWELRPTTLDDLGLAEALTDYVATWSKYFGLPVQLHTRGMQRERLAGDIEIMLYRVAQEALNNVVKHAAAKRVELILERRADHVSLIIEDDGVGFDPDAVSANAKGFGLRGMRERVAFAGGTVAFESRPDEGTTIFFRIPT